MLETEVHFYKKEESTSYRRNGLMSSLNKWTKIQEAAIPCGSRYLLMCLIKIIDADRTDFSPCLDISFGDVVSLAGLMVYVRGLQNRALSTYIYSLLEL